MSEMINLTPLPVTEKVRVVSQLSGWQVPNFRFILIKRGCNNARKGGTHSGLCGWKAKRYRGWLKDLANKKKVN